MIYADTNVLLSLLCEDDLSGAADAWYQEMPDTLAISQWLMLEFRSNIGLRVRKKLISRSRGMEVMSEFDQFVETSAHVIAPEPNHFSMAGDWLARPECALRSGDALHLAVAFGSRCREFVSFDRPLAAAAKRLNLPVTVLRP